MRSARVDRSVRPVSKKQKLVTSKINGLQVKDRTWTVSVKRLVRLGGLTSLKRNRLLLSLPHYGFLTSAKILDLLFCKWLLSKFCASLRYDLVTTKILLLS